MRNSRLDPQVLAECLSYDPEAGTLTWRERPLSRFASGPAGRSSNARLAGTPAGSLTENGYLAINLKGCRMYAHRAAWVLFHGRDVPAGHRVHLASPQRDDIRICNLSLRATRSGVDRRPA